MRFFARLRNGVFLRSALYKAVTRLSIGLLVALLWNQFLNSGHRLSVSLHAFPILGAVFLTLAWFSYLRFDRRSAPHRSKNPARKAPKRKSGDMADFVEESPQISDSLEPEDRILCAFWANLVCAIFFFFPSLILLIAP